MPTTVRRQSCELASTLALSTETIRRERVSARANANVSDTLDFRRRIRLGVPRALHAFFAALPRSPKYMPPASSRTISISSSPSRSGFSGEISAQRFQQFHRAQIHVEAQALPQRQQSALRPLPYRQRIPFRSAHRAQKNRVGLAASVERLVGSGTPVASMAAPPIGKFLKLKLMVKIRGALAQHRGRGAGHFRPDAVTRQQDNRFLHGKFPVSTAASSGDQSQTPMLRPPHADGGRVRASSAARTCAAEYFMRNRDQIALPNFFRLVRQRVHPLVALRPAPPSLGSYPKSFRLILNALRPECFPSTSSRAGTPTVSGEMISYVSGFLMMPSW